MLETQSLILVLGIIFAVLDGIFTVVVINRGGYEVNPMLRFLVDKAGVTNAVFVTRLAIFGLLGTFWLLSDTIFITSVAVITACAAVFTAKSIFALRP